MLDHVFQTSRLNLIKNNIYRQTLWLPANFQLFIICCIHKNALNKMFILRFTFKMCLTLFFVQNTVSSVEDHISRLVLNCRKCKRFRPLLTQYFTFREDVKRTSVFDISCLCLPTPPWQCADQWPSIWSLETVSLRALPAETGKLIGACTVGLIRAALLFMSRSPLISDCLVFTHLIH